MSYVYVTEEDGRTAQLSRIACANEDRELQLLLERNLNILPGDQINPGQGLRWLLVKREMPVVNPSSGENYWSVDFLLADQDGIPTLVECKRHDDTRARREVVGQMLEYAANGRHYWTASDLRSHAQSTAGDESQLIQKLKALTGSDTVPDEFFALMERNLQRSKMRLVFFLDDSPLELRSIIEFLNGQLKDMEVLIVEARQYQHGNARIIVPWLFGFTEEARVTKRESKAETERLSLAKGEAPFWEAIESSALRPEWKDALRDFVSAIAAVDGCQVRWLKTCLIDLPDIVPQRTLASVYRDGSLLLYLPSWKIKDGSPLSEAQSTAHLVFLTALRATFGFSAEDLQSKQYPSLPPEKWIPNASKLTEVIARLGAISSHSSTKVEQSEDVTELVSTS